MSAFIRDCSTSGLAGAAMASSVSRRRLLPWLGAAIVVAAGVSGCGKKGDLELPPRKRAQPVEPIGSSEGGAS